MNASRNAEESGNVTQVTDYPWRSREQGFHLVSIFDSGAAIDAEEHAGLRPRPWKALAGA